MSYSESIWRDRDYWHEDEGPFMEVNMKDYYEDEQEDDSSERFEKVIIKKSRIPRNYLIFDHYRYSGIYVSSSYEDLKERPSKVLVEDLSKLLYDQDTTDFTLKTKTKNFRIHKLIFGARSCVFQAMFQTNMAEALAGEATIEDLDDDTMEEMIHFIYTGRLSGKQFDKLSLLYAAKKYQLDSLQDLIILDMKAAEEPGQVADIFIASKVFKNLFEIGLEKLKKNQGMLEDARFKEKVEGQPMLLSKIKEKF